jgi:hypothetical protein
MKLTPTVKRKITRDWLGKFPQYGVYKPMWLLRRAGPILLGIILERNRGNDWYYPIFHLHNLASAFPCVSLTLAHNLKTIKTGSREFIEAEFHESKYAEAADRLCHQAPLSCADEIHLSDVLDLYAKGFENPFLAVPTLLYKDIVTILAWAGARKEAREYLDRALIESSQWRPQAIENEGGLDLWRARLEEAINNPDQVRMVVAEEIIKHRLEKIPSAGLIV